MKTWMFTLYQSNEGTMRKQLLIIAFVMIFGLMVANMGMAQSDTGDLSVTATVAESCRIITVNEVAFGAYDTTDPADNDNGTGSIVFQCVQDTTYRTYIDGTREMTGATSPADTLTFQLFSDSGRNTAYLDAANGPTSTAPDNNDITSNIFGRIQALQDVKVDDYSTILTATVEY